MLRKITTVATGNIVGQLLSLAGLPILLRLYSPEQFGTYSTVISISVFFSYIFCLRFDLSFVLANKIREYKNLLLIFSLLVIFNFFITFIAFFLIYTFDFKFANKIGVMFLAIPLFACLFSFALGFISILNRNEEYKTLSFSGGIQPALTIITQIFFGFTQPNLLFHKFGLILGRILGSTSTIIYLFFVYRKKLKIINFNFVSFKSLKLTFLKFKKFPVFSTPYSCIDLLSKDGLVILLSFWGYLSTAGYLGLARLVIFSPVNLLSHATNQVFYKQVSISDSREIEELFQKLTHAVLRISPPILALIIVFTSPIFLLIRPNWEPASFFIILLCPLAISTLISQFCAKLLEAVQQQQYLFKSQIIFDMLNLVVTLYLLSINSDVIIIALISIGFSVACHFYQIYITYFIFKFHPNKIIYNFIFFLLVTIVFVFFDLFLFNYLNFYSLIPILISSCFYIFYFIKKII